MRFFYPQAFWLFLGILILLFLGLLLEKHAHKKLRKFATQTLLSTLLKGDPRGRRKLKLILACLALSFAVFALARPQLGTKEEIQPSEGLDIVFLLDVSNSMLAEDVAPNRLKKAKHIIKNFLERLSGDRAGIVAFAGSAYPAVPLTTDYEFIKQTLEILDEKAITNQGTMFAKAVQVGMELLEKGGLSETPADSHIGLQQESSSRVMIILGDGESHEGEEKKHHDKLKELGIRIYSIGLGSTKGGPIPMRDENSTLHGYKKDSSGNLIHTKLEKTDLETLASKTGGKFFYASSNEGEVEEIISSLKSLDRTEGAGKRVIVYEEFFQYPLIFGIALFLIMLGLREAKTVVLFVGILFIPFSAQATNSVQEYQATKKGVKAYENKDYSEAIQNFGKAQALNPDATNQHLNLGDALLKGGLPEGAVSEFEHVTKSKDINESAKGSYNLGKAYAAKQDQSSSGASNMSSPEASNMEMALRSLQAGLDRLKQDPQKADTEIYSRIKRALEATQQQKNQPSQQQKEGKNQDQDKQNQEPKQYRNPKPKFKAEKISEDDAKRILKQLQEQEQKTQKRVLREKTNKPKDEKNLKDW